MSEQITFFYWLMGISGALIGVTLTVIIILVKNNHRIKSEQEKGRDSIMTALIEKVDNIIVRVEKLVADIRVDGERNLNRDINCKGIHEGIDNRLNEYSKRITELEREVIEIKSKIKD